MFISMIIVIVVFSITIGFFLGLMSSSIIDAVVNKQINELKNWNDGAEELIKQFEESKKKY